MKKLALAIVFAASASTAIAGGMAEPMSDVVVVEEIAPTRGGSAGGFIVPLIFLGLLAAAAS